jgi:hypothetical protein
MHLTIRVDRTSARRWLLELVNRLRQKGHSCSFEVVDTRIALPTSVDRLIDLERLLYRFDGTGHCEKVDWSALSTRDLDARSADAILDLSASGTTQADRLARLHVQSDGHPAELGTWSAALSSRMPTILVTDVSTGTVVASGEPCADNSASVSERVNYAFEGCIGVIVMALSRWKRGGAACAMSVGRSPPLRISPLAALEYLCRSIAFSAARYLYHLCCYAPHWRIGWRMLEAGEAGVYETLALAGRPWRVLPDPGIRFYADPFPIQLDGRHFIFFEEFDHRKQIARISYVEIGPDGSTSPARAALEEPFHLSYPFLFEHGGQIWMLPESSADRTLSLYRADPLPHRWTKEATVIADVQLSDATLVCHGGQLWMFACERASSGSYSDTLSLFTAPELKGPWRPHVLNPVLINQREARPAGGFFARDGKLWRPVQDCHRGYGTGIGLAEVTRLDETGYEQAVRAVLSPGSDWSGRRLHTLTRYGALECIDGSANSLKFPRLTP